MMFARVILIYFSSSSSFAFMILKRKSQLNCIQSAPFVIIFSGGLKPGLHVTSAFAFSFYLCRHVIENAKVKCKHHHLLLQNPFMTFDADTDITCKQALGGGGALRTHAPYRPKFL